MRIPLGKIFLIVFAVILLGYGTSSADYIEETIHYNYICPRDTHTYDYASTLVFCRGGDRDSCHLGINIGTNPTLPDSIIWYHSLPPGFQVPPNALERARLWIDGKSVNSTNNIVGIQGILGWATLDPLNPDDITYDLTTVSVPGFWNQDSLMVVVWAGESLVKINHAELIIDYSSDTTKPVLTCSGGVLTCDSTLASATVTSIPSEGVSYLWSPEPVSGQGTDHAIYDTPGTKKVVVTISVTGAADSCEAEITQNITKPVLICEGDSLTADSLMASATVISDPSEGVSYLWSPEPVSGQGTESARYDIPGMMKVVVTILATGCKDSCEAEVAIEHTDVKEEGSSTTVRDFSLSQNYPNPFNPETKISFNLPQRALVSLAVFNIFGQKVKDLIHATLPTGSYTVTWDGTDDQGNRIASGTYFCRLSASNNTSILKMVLLK